MLYMNREEISKDIGNIDDKYIIEVEEYSQATIHYGYLNLRKPMNRSKKVTPNKFCVTF